MIPPALIVWVYLITALLAVVVVVGLWQGILDVTPVALTLIGALGGVTGGAVLRATARGNGEDK